MAFVLAEPLDSGCLDVEASTVVGTAIVWRPRKTYAGKWWHHYGTVTGTLDETMTLDIPTAASFNAIVVGTRHATWAYSVNGPWFEFDTHTYPTGLIRHTKTTPFTQNVVHIAYYPVYTWAKLEADVAAWKASPYVQPTASADGNLVFNTVPAVDNGFGRTCPLANLYGFRITDPDETGPKNVALFTGGNHPGEYAGKWAIRAAIEFLLSADARAVAIRRAWTIYVYPDINPQGHYGGLFRQAPGGADNNRIWTGSVGATMIKFRNAFIADVPASIHFFCDWHCYQHNYGSGSNLHNLALIEGVTSRQHPAWLAYMRVHDPDYTNVEFPAVTGTLPQWIEANKDGGGLTVSETCEAGSTELYNQPEYEEFGKDIIRALSDATVDGLFPVVPVGPSVASVTPSSGDRGATNLVLTVLGSGFVSGAAATFSGTGITVDSTTFVNAGQLTVTIDIDVAATLSARTVTVTNPDTSFGTRTNGFTVTNPVVSITSVTPGTGEPDAVNLALAIVGTGFAVGAVTTFSGTGITVHSTVRHSATSLTVTISIAAGAALTARNVTVTNPSTSFFTLTSGFTVEVVVPSTSVVISSFRRRRR